MLNFNDQAFDLFHSTLSDTLKGHLIRGFNSVVDKHVPLSKFRLKSRYSPWFSTELSALFHSQNKAWNLARKSNDPLHRLAFRQFRNRCIDAVRKSRADFNLYCLMETSYRVNLLLN